MAKPIADNIKIGSDSIPLNSEEVFDNWDNANLKKLILRGIYSYGFEKPSPIQANAIIPMIGGKDIIGQAQSGTGKTGTFLISTLQIINPELKKIQALILSPTRELSEQIFIPILPNSVLTTSNLLPTS